MKTILKLVMVLALFCGPVMADGDQPNGGRTDCTIDCPAPCTENCESGEGSAAVDESDVGDALLESEFEFIATHLLVRFANEFCRMHF